MAPCLAVWTADGAAGGGLSFTLLVSPPLNRIDAIRSLDERTRTDGRTRRGIPPSFRSRSQSHCRRRLAFVPPSSVIMAEKGAPTENHTPIHEVTQSVCRSCTNGFKQSRVGGATSVFSQFDHHQEEDKKKRRTRACAARMIISSTPGTPVQIKIVLAFDGNPVIAMLPT